MDIWLGDLEKAIAALRAKDWRRHLFCSISINWMGDFIFEVDDGCKYIVKHEDFSVWQNFGNKENPDWREIK